jgi:hypothetical protein
MPDILPIKIEFNEINSVGQLVIIIAAIGIVYILIRLLYDWNKSRLEKDVSAKIAKELSSIINVTNNEISKMASEIENMSENINELIKDRVLYRSYVMSEISSKQNYTSYEQLSLLLDAMFDAILNMNYNFVLEVLTNNNIESNSQYIEKKIEDEAQSYVSYIRSMLLNVVMYEEVSAADLIKNFKYIYESVLNMNKCIIFEYRVKPDKAFSHIKKGIDEIKVNTMAMLEEEYKKIKQ